MTAITENYVNSFVTTILTFSTLCALFYRVGISICGIQSKLRKYGDSYHVESKSSSTLQFTYTTERKNSSICLIKLVSDSAASLS